jgi:tetratricopeptide (TPR) repeat protein
MARITSFEEYRDLTYEAVEDYNNKEYDKALEKFSSLAETNPKNPKVREVLILVCLKLKMYERAQEEYKVYIQLLGESMPELKMPERKTFEEVVESAGDQSKLEKDYKSAMKKKKNFDVYNSCDTASKLGVVYMARGEYRKAEEILLDLKTKIIENCPENLRHCLSLVEATA